MDKELTIQDLEAQADALLAAGRRDGGAAARGHGQEQAPRRPRTRPPRRRPRRWTKRSSPDCPPPSSCKRVKSSATSLPRASRRVSSIPTRHRGPRRARPRRRRTRARLQLARRSRRRLHQRRHRAGRSGRAAAGGPSPRSRRRSWSTPMIWWTASPSTIRCVCTSRRSARCPCSPPTRRSRSRPG